MKKLAFCFILLHFVLQSIALGEVLAARPNSASNTSLSDYDLLHYDFRLNVETGSRFIQGYIKIKAKSLKQNLDAFEFQLHDNYTVDSIVYAGWKMPIVNIGSHRKAVILSPVVQKSDIFELTIYYRGAAPLSSNDWGNGVVQKKESKYNAEVFYTLSVPYHAYEWFPCKQVLGDLIDSVKMTIVTQKENNVISNGLMINDNDLPDGKHAVTWKSNYPINYYLISFNVGKYVPYHFDVSLPGKTDGKMPVLNYLYNQTSLTKQKPVLDKIGDFLVNYSGLYGLYPFHREKFGTVVVPLSGGMEHQTIVNLSTDYDKYLAAHEMAHQWWGDNVIINSYHDVWLSEGWATYSEYITAEKLFPAEAKGLMDKFHANALTQSAGQTYIVDTSNFSTIYNYNNVYMKGAAIIHTLRAEIDDDALFFNVLGKFQQTYAHKNVGVAEFKAFIESETGKNLDLFFSQWYYGYGYPKFAISWANSNDKLVIRSVQTTSSAKTPLFKTNVEFLVKRMNFPDTVIRIYQFANEQTFLLSGLKDVTSIVLDPRNIILNKLISNKMDPTLSTEEDRQLDENAVSIFPNPASDILQIRTLIDGSWKVELFTEAGAQILTQNVTGREIFIPLHVPVKGALAVKITDSRGRTWSRMVMLNR